MVGLFPGWAKMREKVRLGYIEAEVIAPNHLLPAGSVLRGREFHYSDHPGTPDAAVYRFADGRLEGFASAPVLASYMHVHFGTDPRLAPAFVEMARHAGVTV